MRSAILTLLAFALTSCTHYRCVKVEEATCFDPVGVWSRFDDPDVVVPHACTRCVEWELIDDVKSRPPSSCTR